MKTSFGSLDQLRTAVSRGHKIDRVPRDPYWMDHVFEDTWYWNDDVKRLVQEGGATIEKGEFGQDLKPLREESGK